MDTIERVEEPQLSPLAEALSSVGDRWTLLVIQALLDGPRRFGDLQKRSFVELNAQEPVPSQTISILVLA